MFVRARVLLSEQVHIDMKVRSTHTHTHTHPHTHTHVDLYVLTSRVDFGHSIPQNHYKPDAGRQFLLAIPYNTQYIIVQSDRSMR